MIPKSVKRFSDKIMRKKGTLNEGMEQALLGRAPSAPAAQPSFVLWSGTLPGGERVRSARDAVCAAESMQRQPSFAEASEGIRLRAG
jgi:hypothetical protein